jgi:hypothetical protein
MLYWKSSINERAFKNFGIMSPIIIDCPGALPVFQFTAFTFRTRAVHMKYTFIINIRELMQTGFSTEIRRGHSTVYKDIKY